MGHAILGFLLKFVLFLGLPAIGLWLLVTVLAAPLASFMPLYVKMVLSPVWFLASFFTALLGWRKRFSVGVYFIISLALSPLVGLLVVLVSDKRRVEE